jgi:hypothetical protein
MIFGPNLITEAEATVNRIQDNLKVVRSHQESYANKRRRPIQFEVGDHAYQRISLMKGAKRFGMKGKLTPRYIGPFPIHKKCGTMAYYNTASFHYNHYLLIYSAPSCNCGESRASDLGLV